MKLAPNGRLHIGMREHDETCANLDRTWKKVFYGVRQQPLLILAKRWIM